MNGIERCLQNLWELEVVDCLCHEHKPYEVIGKLGNLRKLSIERGPGFVDSLGEVFTYFLVDA